MNVAVLVSGGGTNLQALIDYEKNTAGCPYTLCLWLQTQKKLTR